MKVLPKYVLEFYKELVVLPFLNFLLYFSGLVSVLQRQHEIDGYKLQISEKPVPKKRKKTPAPSLDINATSEVTELHQAHSVPQKKEVN